MGGCADPDLGSLRHLTAFAGSGHAYKYASCVDAPLKVGQDQITLPEPGTLLLLGTGIAGLVSDDARGRRPDPSQGLQPGRGADDLRISAFASFCVRVESVRERCTRPSLVKP